MVRRILNLIWDIITAGTREYNENFSHEGWGLDPGSLEQEARVSSTRLRRLAKTREKISTIG
jgi:hypothetical protein